MNTKWQGYLLDFDWVDSLHDEKRGLNTLLHSDIVKHAIWGPVAVVGAGHYAARKAFFKTLQSLNLPKNIKFVYYNKYMYVKNCVDGRGGGVPNKADLVEAFQVLTQHSEVKV
ncbi:hypothetical protein LCGC14_0683690 [marine sediment metagenome]|uniref:Uncharacterized protein n=1 Tax=marine sediment metagenome TaxID=412755 RepID=A0A0F9TVK1_9ZZZZ